MPNQCFAHLREYQAHKPSKMNKFIASVALLACVLAANAYDFHDTDYNQYLASQFEDADDSMTLHPRARRDEDAAVADKDKCHKRHHFKFCCAEEALKKIHDEDKQLKKECFKQVTGKDKREFFHSDPFKCDKEKIEKAKNEINCVCQCVGEKHGTIDAAGNLVEDKIREITKKALESETYLGAKVDTILDTCIAEAKKAPGKNGETCSTQGLTFGHCFWRELQTSCPADQIKDQKACDRVLERIKNNPEHPFPYHKHDDE